MKLLDILLEKYKDEYELNLNEGLIKTAPLGQSVSILKRKFPSWKFHYTEQDNYFVIQLLRKNGGMELQYFDELLPLLNNLGWFISWTEVLTKDSSTQDKYKEAAVRKALEDDSVISIALGCEAKFDQKVNKIPDVLYHVTPNQNWDKIKNVGLVPKSRSKASYHPERVFLAKTEKYAEDLGKKFYRKTGIKDWTLLRIDTALIPGDYFRLYKDPNYKGRGYYSLNNIPPQAIQHLRDIKL